MFCLDVIYCFIIVGCNNVIVMVLMLIIADVFIGRMYVWTGSRFL